MGERMNSVVRFWYRAGKKGGVFSTMTWNMCKAKHGKTPFKPWCLSATVEWE